MENHEDVTTEIKAKTVVPGVDKVAEGKTDRGVTGQNAGIVMGLQEESVSHEILRLMKVCSATVSK